MTGAKSCKLDSEAAVVLCGGMARRLRGQIPEDTPKILADINGRPFLSILETHLDKFGKVVFLAGHNSGPIAKYLDQTRKTNWLMIVELRPLGTAGAVIAAARFLPERFFVLNGDTWWENVDFADALEAHERANSKLTVLTDADGACAGAYIVQKVLVQKEALKTAKPEFVDMAELIGLAEIAGVKVLQYRTASEWIDIGTPEGLETMRKMLKKTS